MAQIADGSKVYVRLVTGISAKEFMVYNSIADAQKDPSPNLSSELYSADLTLLGNIRPVLIPVGGFVIPPPPNPRQAVNMILIVGQAIDK